MWIMRGGNRAKRDFIVESIPCRPGSGGVLGRVRSWLYASRLVLGNPLLTERALDMVQDQQEASSDEACGISGGPDV